MNRITNNVHSIAENITKISVKITGMEYMSVIHEYEKKVEQNRKDNELYLAWFRQDLEEKGLKPKTIKKHLDNMNLYLNDYLQYEAASTME